MTGKTHIVKPTDLGKLLYDETMNKRYIAWKAQLQAARELKHAY